MADSDATSDMTLRADPKYRSMLVHGRYSMPWTDARLPGVTAIFKLLCEGSRATIPDSRVRSNFVLISLVLLKPLCECIAFSVSHVSTGTPMFPCMHLSVGTPACAGTKGACNS